MPVRAAAQDEPMTVTTPSRPPLASAAILVAVLLLFGAATFVAGLAVGGSDAVGQSDGSASAAPSAAVPSSAETPQATPILETITCAEPSEAFAVLCETYAQIKGEYVDEITDEELVDGAVRGMIEY